MVLEVIEQNTAGVKLYQKVGFKTLRRLVGYKLENPYIAQGDVLAAADGGKSNVMKDLQEVDIRELARLVTCHGLKDLPWQLSGATIVHHTPPSRAFRWQDAYCLISNPEAEHVAISSVLVKSGSRGAGLSPVLMRAVFARFPNKVWHVPAIFPEEMSIIFEQVSMQREEISQWQMALTAFRNPPHCLRRTVLSRRVDRRVLNLFASLAPCGREPYQGRCSSREACTLGLACKAFYGTLLL